VTLDSAGNAYVTGPYRNTVDFDPGPGNTSFTSNAGASNNIYFSKFNPEGTFVDAHTSNDAEDVFLSKFMAVPLPFLNFLPNVNAQ
jgi:hypothetical protein